MTENPEYIFQQIYLNKHAVRLTVHDAAYSVNEVSVCILDSRLPRAVVAAISGH